MNEQRRVRFASLEPFTRDDLPLIVEVWRDDVVRAPWASRETMKLAGILTSYILSPASHIVALDGLENLHHLQKQEVQRALGMLSIFGLVEAFNIDGNQLRVALRLTLMQTVRVSELKRALAMPGSTQQADNVVEAERPEPRAAREAWVPDAPQAPRTELPQSQPVEPSALGVMTRDLRLLQRMAEAVRKE